MYRLLVVLLLCVAWAQGRTLGAQPISVHPKTLRLIDEFHREVYFHGVNVVVKGPPWIPDTATFSPLFSFTTKDMTALQSLGINGIRLGTMWPGVEPQRGNYNSSYLNALYQLVQTAASFGIYSLLDMHQDVMSEKFCGEGVPLWAAIPNNNSGFPWPMGSPYPVDPTTGVPSKADCLSKDWAGYYFTEAAGSAFQNLYNNAFGLRDSFANFWAIVAKKMAPLGSAVLGYELMNEPWAGNAVSDILLMVPGVADKQNLQPTWDVAAAAIRAVDTTHAIFFEGVTWDWLNVGFTDVPGGAALWKNKSVLSYHFYIPPDFSLEDQFNARQQDMKRLQCGGFLTEYGLGACAGCGADITQQVMNACDKYFQSWLIWEYKPFAHNKTGWSKSIWFDNGTLNIPIASELSRTYAQVVAGVAQVIQYNNNTQAFLLTFQVDPYVTANKTIIYLNEQLHYPNGFVVHLTNTVSNTTGVVSYTHPSVNTIEVVHNPKVLVNGYVTVEITAK